MTGWLLALTTTVGGGLVAIVVIVVKADLEDADVYRWATRKLIYRAAQQLPRGERARWREQMMRDALDLPGRLPPLLWALDTYVRAGRWGRMRGVPSRWQALIGRMRLAWYRLRNFRRERARAAAKARHPAFNRPPAAPAQPVIVALETAAVVVTGATASSGIATYEPTPWATATSYGWREGMMHLDHPDFVRWLSHQREAFEDDVDRKVTEYRQRRDHELVTEYRQRRDRELGR